ncbi:hypothetical protein BDY19DRAFT_1004927 [Irpex rosettiformis]|uniref:Uncharacterized protein n=1 Tax=Irpex rosettiformis TaxID=378272 RepID=A0ACB8U5U1_9APHY|nr:hypothetical protein BDY19DRAFT_1004927 [Irpex rosettiformis]
MDRHGVGTNFGWLRPGLAAAVAALSTATGRCSTDSSDGYPRLSFLETTDHGTTTLPSPATSTAPSVQIGTKRRLSDDDDDGDGDGDGDQRISSNARSMPPPTSLPGTPTTPGFGSVTKRQRVGGADVDVEGEDKGGSSVDKTEEGGEVEEGVKEVTEGVKEVEITEAVKSDDKEDQVIADAQDTNAQDATVVDTTVEDTTAKDTIAKDATPAEPKPIDEAASAPTTIPLPDSPLLQSQSESTLPVDEQQISTLDVESTQVKGDEEEETKLPSNETKEELETIPTEGGAAPPTPLTN